MTNASSDQLDRIENDPESVKDILLTVARRAEATDERPERYAEASDKRLEQLTVRVYETTTNVNNISKYNICGAQKLIKEIKLFNPYTQ